MTAYNDIDWNTHERDGMKKSTLILCLPLTGLLLGNSCTEVHTSTEIESTRKVSDKEGNFNGDLDNGDRFASAIANIGDLEGDGVIDLVVGTPGNDDNGDNRGAVWILFMDRNGFVDTQKKITQNTSGFNGDLDNNDQFGAAVAGIGDLNGDGFRDIAVGAPFDDDGGDDRGAVWILFMNADGTVQSQQKISHQQGSLGGELDNDEHFGSAVAAVGDLDQDGIIDLAVGAPRSNDDSRRRGTVWILFMQRDGTVRSSQKIDTSNGNFDGQLADQDRFGHSLAAIGDLNKDGVPDLAVGADGDDQGGNNYGAVWILFMNSNGNVSDERKITVGEADFDGNLSDDDRFGSAVALVGDQDNDGTEDIAVGARQDDDGGDNQGAVWLLLMKPNGRVNRTIKISETQSKFNEDLSSNDEFGNALAGLGNLDIRNNQDFAVGVALDDDGSAEAGAFWVLFMELKEDEERVGLFD